MNEMFLLRAILACAVVMTGAASQHAKAAESADYLITYWTSDNGLPDTSVTAVTQTSDGYLWIGTHNGLARFDGARFTVFDPANTSALKNARVYALFTDDHHTLWINTFDGSMTSLRDGRFKHEWLGAHVMNVFTVSNRVYFTTVASGTATRIEYPDPATSNTWQTLNYDAKGTTARLFCQDASGAIWCLLRDGQVVRIIGTNVVALPDTAGLNGEKVNYITAAPGGHIWAATDKRILRWSGKHFENVITNGENPMDASFLFCTATNGIWTFTDHSVRHAVNRKWMAGTRSWSELVQANPIFVQGYEDSDGNVWFRQFGQGLYCAYSDGNFARICLTNGLPDNRVTCWCQDWEGNIWVGMERGGLARLRQRQFQVVGGNLRNVPVATICEDSQTNVWIGTFDNGLNLLHDGQLKHFQLPEGANRTAFFSAYPDAKDQLWLSADHEDLFVLDTNRVFRRVDAIHGFKAILADSQDRIWLGRHNWLTKINHGQIVNYNQRNGFARCTVRALAEDKQGNIWIGGGNGILYEYADGKFSAYQPEDYTNHQDQAIWSLLPEDNGAIWVGTFRGGLLRFKNGKFNRYTAKEGLPNDIICQILDDGLGRLWLGSHQGIFYITKNSFAELDNGKIQSLPCVDYGMADGLPTLECSGGYQPSAWRGRDGRLWFATVKGAVSVNPRHLHPNLLPPPVLIEDVILDGRKILKQDGEWRMEDGKEASSSLLHSSNRLKITPGKHSLNFEFTALSFTAPGKVRFRYRLDGFDKGWVEDGDKRTAHYGPLPPGHYKFQVTACNNDGVWNSTGASLDLVQRPYFWQTWWFALLAFVMGGLAVAGSLTYAATRRVHRKLERFKQQRAIEMERERIARDIHDDLGAGLTQIMFQSSLGINEPPERMKTDLSQISETARDLARNMDEIVWAINPENDTLDDLVTYLGKYVQDFLMAANLRCRLDLPTKLPAIIVPAETRHNVYLAIKETLNNVAKHAKATEVSFQLQVQSEAFAFIIKDNGSGMMTGKAATDSKSMLRIASGHGLRNIPERIGTIGGSCLVSSQPGQGTQVELIIPFTRSQNKATERQ